MKNLIVVGSQVAIGRFLVVLAIIFLSACGGGGGGGGSSSGGGTQSSSQQNGFSLALNPEKISSSCYETELCEVKVRATYQGTVPTGTVYVKATLDNNVQHFYYGLFDTYADLTLGLQHYMPKGNYTGQVTIDICADENCAKRYGSRYTIPYTWKVMSNWPTFHLGVQGTGGSVESNNELRLSGNMGETSPIYELKIDMPGAANTVSMPQEFIDLYKVKKISETDYQLQLPEGGSSSRNYAFTFAGPNYGRVVDVSIYTNIKRKMTPLPLQTVFTVYYDTFVGQREVSAGNYADGLCGQTIEQSLTLLKGSDWAKLSPNGGCSVTLIMNPPSHYGLYEARLKIDATTIDPFELPVVMSYSKTGLDYNKNDITITPATTEAELAGVRFFAVYSKDKTLQVSSASKWITNVTSTISSDTVQSYDFTIDVNEIKKLNPMSSSANYWYGVFKVDNSDPNGDFGVGTITLVTKVPYIYSMTSTTTPASLPFKQTIAGDNLSDLGQIQLITLGQDDKGNYTKTIATKAFYPEGGYTLDFRTGKASFQMPALEKGMYQVNFAGMFAEHFNKLILNVE